MKKIFVGVVILGLALCLVGCGGGSGVNEQQQPTESDEAQQPKNETATYQKLSFEYPSDWTKTESSSDGSPVLESPDKKVRITVSPSDVDPSTLSLDGKYSKEMTQMVVFDSFYSGYEQMGATFSEGHTRTLDEEEKVIEQSYLKVSVNGASMEGYLVIAYTDGVRYALTFNADSATFTQQKDQMKTIADSVRLTS